MKACRPERDSDLDAMFLKSQDNKDGTGRFGCNFRKRDKSRIKKKHIPTAPQRAQNGFLAGKKLFFSFSFAAAAAAATFSFAAACSAASASIFFNHLLISCPRTPNPQER